MTETGPSVFGAPDRDGNREGRQLLAIVLWIVVTGSIAVLVAYGAL
jgi:hypothetical protein